jgi:hypothetical protein
MPKISRFICNFFVLFITLVDFIGWRGFPDQIFDLTYILGIFRVLLLLLTVKHLQNYR